MIFLKLDIPTKYEGKNRKGTGNGTFVRPTRKKTEREGNFYIFLREFRVSNSLKKGFQPLVNGNFPLHYRKKEETGFFCENWLRIGMTGTERKETLVPFLL